MYSEASSWAQIKNPIHIHHEDQNLIFVWTRAPLLGKSSNIIATFQ